MSRQKRTLIFSIFIVIGISLIVYLVSNEILFARVDDERLKLVKNIHKEELLIGMEYDECEKLRGPVKFENDKAWVFPGGYTYSKIKGRADWERYDLWVYYDDNNIAVSTSIERDQSG